jgi:hypothetical protein
MFNLRNPPFNLLARIATTLEENFTKRWDMMVTENPLCGCIVKPVPRGCSRNTREWQCEMCIEQGGA